MLFGEFFMDAPSSAGQCETKPFLWKPLLTKTPHLRLHPCFWDRAMDETADPVAWQEPW